MFRIYRSVRKVEQKSKLWSARKWSSMSLVNGKPKKRPTQKCPQYKVTDKVKMQSIMYASAFLIVWIFPTITRIIQISKGTVHPIFVVLSGTFIGSQGIFNAIIYFRPRYTQCQAYDRWDQKVLALVRSTLFPCCDSNADYTKDDKDYVPTATPTPDGSQNNTNAGLSVSNDCCKVRNDNVNDEEKQEEECAINSTQSTLDKGNALNENPISESKGQE
mmetsp:Transcript_988/g.1624  ORF Transcript_988/g.1624 Transcript_988/m.1624 type:complete len:218 (-) Transcript_988:761-1414(-)